MTFVTAGRIGSYMKAMGHFKLYRFGVKLYKIHVTRKGKAVMRYAGFVPGTVTLDRLIRPKAVKRAEQYATANGFIYRWRLRHNDPVPAFEALIYAADDNNNNTNSALEG
jgi:hypothetical protein